MIKGVKIRFEIHNILFSIYKFNRTLNDFLIKKQINKQKKEDIAFLYNVTLNSMRLHLHCLKIIDKLIMIGELFNDNKKLVKIIFHYVLIYKPKIQLILLKAVIMKNL